MAETLPDVSRRVAERADVPWEEAQGRIVVRRRRTGRVGGAVLRLFGIPADVTVHLDPLGSEAWLLMDGSRTVAAIRTELESRHPGEPDLALRLGRFLGTMVSKGFVRLR
ncbi:MAG TPA: PqqD family protein [Candidatus Thermoplasmatota archaeon]|nr:PqqD family protein [Candidatus Thermoplasmatota archaeon]